MPISVGTSRGAIDGRLYWTPESSKAPLAVIILGVAILVGGLLFVLFVRRRRSAPSSSAARAQRRRVRRSPEESW